MAGEEGLEPPICGIKIRCVANYATPQNLVDSLGFEPRTYRLKVGCSEPAELRVLGGEGRIRTYSLYELIYSQPRLSNCAASPWCQRMDSNHRPNGYQPFALPTELHWQTWHRLRDSNPLIISNPGFGDQCATPTAPNRLKLFPLRNKKPLLISLLAGVC